MCFGSSDSGSTSNPAPYSTDQSHTAVKFQQEAAPPKPAVQETEPQPEPTTQMVGTGLNVKGM